MDKSLNKVQEELAWLIKDLKATTNYQKSKFLETLSYYITYEKKKIKLTFDFLLMPKDDSMSLSVNYQIKDTLREIHSFDYPFSKIRSGLKFPMIDDYDFQRVNDVMDFEILDGKIKPTVSKMTKALTFTEVIRRNIENFMNHGIDLKDTIHTSTN